ncbi:MAG: VWA domain-containing protein [Clostridiales Family XIII bacterium]|jgi:stress response protein SCP2|nr:VWA domain-containing protein [Clostridiales Family XIII bacterium]
MGKNTQIQRGFRGKIGDYFDSSNDLFINLKIAGGSLYESCCFGLDANERLSDDSYMVFYNQKSSPKEEIVLERSGNDSIYRFNLAKLPSNINKLAFTVSIDSEGVMSQVTSFSTSLYQKGGFFGGITNSVDIKLSGGDFQQEKALIAFEVYKKDVWRLSAPASGFNGGLSALLKHFGGPEFTTSLAPDSGPTSNSKLSLEKRLEKEAPQLVSLAKPLKVVLEKNKLTDTVARVALVMDISGSMAYRYQDGSVQEVVNKTVPLALQFDDDGELDFWYYGSIPRRMEPITTKNYQRAVPANWLPFMRELGTGNNEPAVMNLVIEQYRNSQLPAYVIFITDGGVVSEDLIKGLLINASKLPIFWQFVGLGGSNYGILERLDTMSERFIDNANFFAVDSFRTMSDQELYSKLLGEFPLWLKEARNKGILK